MIAVEIKELNNQVIDIDSIQEFEDVGKRNNDVESLKGNKEMRYKIPLGIAGDVKSNQP
jgi:hypothetical protein